MKIGIVGCGYVGISVAVNMAIKGFECVCYDINQAKIEDLKNGKLPFYEFEFDELFTKVKNNLVFINSMENLINDCDIIFVAVCTPSNSIGRCDLKYLMSAINEINKYSKSPKMIIIKSTCEVGTTQKLSELVSDKLDLVFSPEFLAQGQMKQNILSPSRLVFGLKETRDQRILDKLDLLYAKEKKNGVEIIVTSYNTAELSKYACNSFLAMKISFINKISQLCQLSGADITKVEKIMRLDSRIGKKYLMSGLGFGGSCFDKDLKALKCIMEDNNINYALIDDILNINKEQILNAMAIIEKNKKSNNVLILGTTFKKNTSDLTNSPAIELIDKLVGKGYSVHVFDCVKINLDNYKFFNKIIIETNLKKAIEGVDDIIICSDWDEFKIIKNYDLSSKNIYDFKQLLVQENIDSNLFGIGFTKKVIKEY